MNPRLAFSSEHVHTIPIRLRSLIGKHFASSRWEESCQFYDAMPERYPRRPVLSPLRAHRGRGRGGARGQSGACRAGCGVTAWHRCRVAGR